MKNNYMLCLLTVALAFMLTTGCNNDNLSKGTQVDPVKNELLKLETDKANNGKRVSIAGYPSFSRDIKVGMNDDPVITIYNEPDGKGRLLTSFPIHFGKSANKVYVPEEFTNADIVLYDNEGNSHKYNEKMLFSFTLDMQLNQPRLNRYLLNDFNLSIKDSPVMVYPTYLKDIRIDKAQ